MILAGDVGGTKTVLALISMDRGVEDPVREQRFASGKYASLEAIVSEFLADRTSRWRRRVSGSPDRW